MSLSSAEQTVGRWRHSEGGRVQISMDSDGESVVIVHPILPTQKLPVSKFLSESELVYFGYKGKLCGDEIVWNNGVVWTRQIS
mmetsp:Transcript_12630/g.23771  ORF Transcript_12630/g.23771 Transcript_12630/m.23771 type:complete len:83 (-) Transcript_12630:54-302(-)